MIDFDAAACIVEQAARPLTAETVPLHEAHGRMLASPVVAQHTSPPTPVSAMDGYAVRDADLCDLPSALKIAGKSFAGAPFLEALMPGTCARVFTGAELPPGADRVVIQEDVTQDGDMARIAAQPSATRHIRAAGSDFTRGDVLLAAGVSLNPQRLVAAAASGRATVEVVRRPRVAIIACGDELVPAGSAQACGAKIHDSISLAVAALARHWNGVIVERWLRPDDLAVLEKTASDALLQADVVVVTGGASVGERDFAKAMFAPHGLQFLFNKVAIRPGKPVWFGAAGAAFVIGLPGNPTSALVTARLFLAPLLTGLAGFEPGSAWNWQAMALDEPLAPGGARESFLRAAMKNGKLTVLHNQDSAAQKSLADATHLIRRPAGAAAIRPGEPVPVLPL